MAGTKALNVRMNFQVDTTQARQQIQQLGVQLNSIGKNTISGANSSLGITSQILEATKAAGQLKNALAEAMNPLTGNLNLSAFNDQLIASKMQLSDYRTQLANLGITGNQAFNSLSRAIMTAETPMLRTGKAAQQMWTVLGNTVRWQATSSMIHGIMGAASQAMNYVKSLDSSLNSIRIVTGQNQAQMERFAKTANQAAKTLNTTTNAYAKASLIYYQQGLSNEEVEKRTATTVKLANVSGQTAAKVSDQLTAIWNNFYDGSKSLEYYADVMTALGASTASSTDEIAKGLEKFSSIAKTTGLSYEYATSALSTVVAATRQSADSVGTSFKTLFSRLQGLQLGETLDDGTTLNKYSKALDVIGVNIKNANGSLKDMDKILDEIGDRWTSLSKAEQVALAQTVGGARNYTGLVSLMDNWDSFQKNLQTAQQAQGTLQKQADIYAESWEAASKHVKAASETIYKNLFDDKFFIGLTNTFGSVLDMTGTLTNQMGGFKGVMSTIANFALNTFAPQMTKSFANIGSSIYGLTSQGQEKVLDLRKQAMNAVTSNIRLSQYDNVDRMAHGFNKAFVDRQVAFDNAVQQGRISEYQQPIYQSLIGQLGQESDRIVAQAEQNAIMANTRRMENGQLLTGIQTGITERRRQLDNEFLRIASDPERLARVRATTAGEQRYQAWNNLTSNVSPFNAAALSSRFDNYATAVKRENIAKEFISFYTKTGAYNLSTPQDMRQTADKLYGLAEAAKASNIALDDVIPGLGKFSTTLTGMGKDISQLSDQELSTLFQGGGRQVDRVLSGIVQALDSGSAGSKIIENNIKDEIRTQLGLQPGQNSPVIDNAMAILKNRRLTEQDRALELSNMGINLSQSKALTSQMEGETIPQTMAMSQALTTNIGMLASLGQIYSGVSAAVKTFGDENATAGQQVASLTSLFMAGSMAVKPFQNFIASAGKEVTVFGNTLKTLGGTSIKNGPLGLAIAGILGATIGGIALYKDQQKNTLNGAIKNYSESIAVATQLTADAQAAYQNLITAQGTHNNLLDNLHNLQYGTLEFTQALLSANDTATNLIESYDLIYGKDYTYGQYGEIEFQKDALDLAVERAEAEAKTAALNKEQSTYASKILENYKEIAGAEADNILYDAKNEGISTYYTNAQGAHLGEGLTVNGLIGAFQQRLFETDNNLSGTAFLQEMSANAQVQGSIVNFDRILSALNFSDLEQLGNFLDQANELQKQYGDSDTYQEALNALSKGGYSQLLEERKSYIQGLVDVTATTNLSPGFKNKDLTSYIASQYLTSTQNEDFINSVLTFANKAGTKTFGEGRYSNPRAWYAALFGEEAGDLSDEAVFQKVSTGIIDKVLTDPHFFDNLELPAELQITGLNDWISEIGGLSNLAETLQNYNLPNLENLNYQEINDSFNRLLQYDESGNNALNTKENQAIQQYRDYAKQIYDNQLNDLATAMLRGIGDGLLNGITETEDSSIFKERVTNLAGQITDNGKEVMASLTYGALKQATNAMINANEVGESTANTMYSLLLRGRTQNGGFDADTLAAIQNYNLDNTIASIYSNNNLKRYAANQAQRDKYIELFSSQIEDIGKEKGWFQMLYNSSGFSDVLDKINSQFQSTGQITAQYITDLAGKSEELSQFLKVSSDNAGLLSVNAGGLAAIFEEMNRGTSGLTSTNISSDFISAVSRAESRSAANASAFEVVDNLDLGRSGLDFLDFFQDMGKEMYQANKAGWGFYSDPIQNIIDKIGGSRVREAYMEANSHGDWNFQQMWNFMKTDERSSGFMTFMESMAGKKGKGGGGPADVMKYLFDTLGGAGFTDEDWNKLGFRVDSKGGFYLREGSDGSKEYTQDQLVKNLTNLLMTDYGWTEEDANNYAQVIMSTASTSGQVGQALDQRGAKAGFKDLFKGLISQEEYDAYYRRYGALMGYKSKEEFDQDFEKRGGQIGLNLKREEWNGITSQDLVKRAQEQGISIRNEYGEQEQVQNFSELADAYGAVTTGGKLDYNKLVTMIETVGGTEEDLIKMLENDQDTVQKLVAKTASGEDIGWTGEGTVRDWVKDVHAAQGDTVFKYSGLSQEAADMAYMYEHMVMSQNEDGTWSWHYETQEDRDKKAAEEQHKADVAKRQQLKEQFGYSDNDIDEAIALGSDYDTLINNAQAEDERKKEQEKQRIETQREAERKAEAQQQEASRNIEWTNRLKALGWSQEDIDRELENGGSLRDLVKNEEAKATAETQGAQWGLTGEQFSNWQALNEAAPGQMSIPEYKKFLEAQAENPELTPGEWFAQNTENAINAQNPNMPENILSDIDPNSIGGRILSALGFDVGPQQTTEPETSGTAGELKPQDILDMSVDMDKKDIANEGPKAPDTGQGKEAPFGHKPEAITDDTYNPTLGMTFSEWQAQKAQQEQQLQQAQLEQESQRQAWQNYQDALSAETDFLAENGDFVTNPENARLAAWTAAARENPDLLGALYQNALKEGYTGDQFTQMYDYQGLHGTTQSALSTAVGGIFNGSSVTAQQRFDFINSAYEKALSQGTTALSPFEKQVLTMIGEIDDNTGTLVEHGEEEGDAATRAKNNQKVNEEGELLDEDGNPIELPQNQQQPSGGGSRDNSGGDTGGGGGPGGGGSGGNTALEKFQNYISDGGSVTVGQKVNVGDKQYTVGVNDNGDYTLEDQDGHDISGDIYLASGQNNTRLLAYASGKEGHIAITGELGPELRVKSDGSMDILGKTGREYAWVEPTDRIYTASQSAGILKSNKIPGLEGLAKGINNFIPGYEIGADWNNSGSSGGGSSSGGGRNRGGGGTPAETDPRYDPNTLKIRDILERYYTILQKIDDITRAVEKFSKVADRAWGQDRIKAIEKQTDLYQQQYDAQKQYVKQIGEYMNTDKNALTTMIREFVEGWNKSVDENPDPNNTMEKISWAGAAFDSNGVLTNYRDFVEKLVEQYNANAEANAMNKEAQYKFQEQLKDIQMYTDTLNLWESETDKLQELANQILDNSLKEITYRVEYELELNADQKRLLDFQDSFVKDDIFRVAEHIANMNDEIANTADSLEKTRKGLYNYLGTLASENMRAGEFYDDVALGIATRDEQGLVSAKNYDDIDFKQVSNTVDSWIKKLSKEDAEEVNKIVQRDANGIITNYRDVVNKINEINEKLSSDSISLLLNDAQQFFDKLSDLTNNPKWTGLSTEMKDQITNYMDQMIQYIQSMGAEFQEIVESMGDSIKAFGKKIDSEIDEFDYYGDVYKSFGNIIDLTNQHMTDITADFFNTLNSKALDNNINKIEAARRRYDLFTKTLGDVQAQYNAMLDRLNNAQGAEEKAFYQQRVDELKEQLDIANSQMESAHKDFLQSWEDALSKIQESYKSAVEQASKDFEKSFSPLFNTLALLQAQFDREKALGDLYVDNYQKIHDLNKLNRDIDQSISDTDNLKSKGRLRDLQKEINDLQEDGTELSEYDLDILDKKYKLELARQALEDARDAKSIVRLSRDNNGNWGYVYTADEDEIAEAEQNYEDAIRDMEEANQNYIDNIQDQILQVQQEAQQAILALQPEDFATYDDYLAAVQNIQNSMYQTLDYLRSQLNNAFGNNDWLETIVPGIVKDHDLTNDFANTPLAQLLVNGNLDSMIDSAKTNLQDNLIKPALEAFTTYSEKQKEVYAAAGKDMATIGQTFGEEMDTLTEKSEEQVDVVMKLADRVEDSFGKTMDAVIKATDDWLNEIKDIVKEYDILLEKITELKKIDGEYVEPAKMINGDNAVDTWEELDRFKRELTSNGTLNLITTDTATGKEIATKYVAGTQATLDFLHGVTVAAAKGDIIDVGEDVDDTEDQKVREYIKQRGLVWVKYKDDSGEHEIMFNSVEEWEEWYKKHKHVDPPADTNSSSSGGLDNWWALPEAHNHAYQTWVSNGYKLDTGGYTGRWQFADTGMYTGEWPSGSVRRNGRLAWLHQKELVLNAHDTENFLDAMQVVRQLDNLTNWMANGLGDLIMPKVTGTDNELEQNVHIEAEFPNVTDHNEIEQAFTNLVNMASQYANRK